jgi:hypothetical protein
MENGNKKAVLMLIGCKDYADMDSIRKHANYNSNITFNIKIPTYILPIPFLIHTPNYKIS